MAFIRPYQKSDFEATAVICRATLPPSLQRSEAGTRLAPYIWTHPYTDLAPQNCFVLDDGGGRCVGYVIGCPDVFAFAAAYHAYVSKRLAAPEFMPRQMAVREPWSVPAAGEGDPMDLGQDGREVVVNEQFLLQIARNPRWQLIEGTGDGAKQALVETYRATMHIDLLEPYQGKGWGRKMIDMFVGGVRGAGGKVVHVAVLDDETGAEREQEMVLDYGKGIHIGVSGENTKVVPFYEKVGFRVHPGGESEGNVWMVYDL
ncbi:hypothetical protein MAPG_01583 [Magnaporthiopsis poae ATCC 64411]|uniref:N-acetyltransferase domain-containing protein n=1 Tax=Magnaporthiopsis poae (strain ATCC 64411 / 73-15) TaxID=644358 RepID=A0A0C4DP32_MAGP6|nr:hypothetical protein MAPG_01583 [Magnaporthiopsis poae ATCC 64411]